MRRETAGAYLKAAGIGVRPPRGWGRAAKPANEVTTDFVAGKRGNQALNEPELSKPANEVTTDSELTEHRSEPSANPHKARTLSSSEPYRDLIELGLQRGRNAMAIWQDLVTEHGFAHSYQSVKRFVNKLSPNAVKQARVVIVTDPGEEAQVDYGTGPWVRDPQSGKYRRTRLFVLTLGFSRKAVRLLVFRSNSRTWAELHEQAFRRLGGSVRIVVLDNLREGVLTADIYEPTLNPLYRDLLAHYGAVAMPCRVRDPDRKAYVSYCPLCRLCSGESWLFGLPASGTFNNRQMVQRFIQTAPVIVVAMPLQQSLSSPGIDRSSRHTESHAHLRGGKESSCS